MSRDNRISSASHIYNTTHFILCLPPSAAAPSCNIHPEEQFWGSQKLAVLYIIGFVLIQGIIWIVSYCCYQLSVWVLVTFVPAVTSINKKNRVGLGDLAHFMSQVLPWTASMHNFALTTQQLAQGSVWHFQGQCGWHNLQNRKHRLTLWTLFLDRSQTSIFLLKVASWKEEMDLVRYYLVSSCKIFVF